MAVTTALGFHLDLSEPWGRAPRGHQVSVVSSASALLEVEQSLENGESGLLPATQAPQLGTLQKGCPFFPPSDRALPVQVNPST